MARLRLGQGVLACTGLGVAPAGLLGGGLDPPVGRVVAVEVESTEAVLADPSVTVVIDPLGVQEVVSVAASHAAHGVAGGVSLVDHVRAVALAHVLAHRGDEAVAVEVERRVLVELAVAVGVVGPDRRTVGRGGVEVEVVAVGVVDGADVDGLVRQQLGDVCLVPVLDQVPGEPERRLGGRHLAGVAVPLEEGRRLVRVLSGGPVGDGQLVDRLTREGVSDVMELDQVRVLVGPLVQPPVDLDARVEVLPVHLSRLQGLDLGVVDDREGARSVPVPAHRPRLAGRDDASRKRARVGRFDHPRCRRRGRDRGSGGCSFHLFGHGAARRG